MRVEDFKDFVKTAKKFYNKSNRISVCDHILFHKDKVKMVNIIDGISVELLLEDEYCEDPFTIPFLDFEKLINKVKMSPISFSVNKDFQVDVITGKGTFTFQGDKEPDEFPLLVKDPTKLLFNTTLSNSELKLIKKAENFAANDESKPVLNSVFVDNDTIVASDAHFLCFLPTEKSRDKTFLIPRNIAKYLGDNKKEVDVFTDEDKFISFMERDKKLTISSKQVDCKYPNYRAVIPQNNPISFSVNTKELLETLDTASISAPYSDMMSIEVKDVIVSVRTQNLDMSKSFHRKLSSVESGDDITFGFNYKKLIAILKAENKEISTFELSSPERGFIINEYYLLMPMMTN